MSTIHTNKRKRIWAIAAMLTILVAIGFSALMALVYTKQDEIVQSQLQSLNQSFNGSIAVADVHIAPFKNFPYVSLKVDSVTIKESKEVDAQTILDVADIYIGFSLADIIRGNFDIQTLLIEEGFFHIIFHPDGTNNIQQALGSADDTESSEPPNIHLKNIKLVNLDIHKFNEETHTDIETFIYYANGGFESDNGTINAHVDTEFELNVMQNADTTFIHHKHFEFHTDLSFDENTGTLAFEPSGLTLENADFDIEGSINTKNDMDLDLSIKGTKSNFDMIIAFAPPELTPVLKRYENAGKIYFNAILKGPSINDQMPFFDAQFGASEAYLKNVVKGRRVDDLGFDARFTNGKEKSLQSMVFELNGIQARLEEGNMTGAVVVKNFEAPEVDMQIKADFELGFISEFFQLEDIEQGTGRVAAELRFHDIVDIDNPQKALTDLNSAYYMELDLDDLRFESPLVAASINSINAHLIMEGKQATLDEFEVSLGNSDLSVTGFLSDLPAVVHHSDKEVTAHMDIRANRIDIAELTQYSAADSTGVDEQLEDLSLGFSFKSSAKSFTESAYLPVGEFFVDSFHVNLKHYPHRLHDFHADILIDTADVKIVEFKGEIDDSDFNIDGLVHDFAFWFQPELEGDVDLDLTWHSDLLRLEDLFSYNGENYVPEDYRHEEFEDLAIHVKTSMHYKEAALHSIDIDIDEVSAKMHVHPMKFEEFRGHIHYEDDHLLVQDFHGKVGATNFDLNLSYYLGDDETIKKRDNYLKLKAPMIDFDQLTNYNPPPAVVDTSKDTTKDVEEHAKAFNVFELPFTDMSVDVDIDQFNYHGLNISDMHARMRTTANHYFYVDTIDLKVADGSVSMSGYFNGSDPQHIYMKPHIVVSNTDIDKLMLKFESFGHDVELSENVHGMLSADLTGNIRVYPDLVPDVDQSEIHLDVQILNGSLVNYEPMKLLSDYMGDKDLSNIRFDTIANHIDVQEGVIRVPNMTIESTLGHYDISGKHNIDHTLEYFVRIPWKTIREGARSKLFGSKTPDEFSDEIIKKDPNAKTKYLNLKISGTTDNFKVGVGKDKTLRKQKDKQAD